MSLNNVPQTYSEALEEGYTTFEVEYSGRGGWSDIRNLFQGALSDTADEMLEDNGAEADPDIVIDTGEVLIDQVKDDLTGYTAVLYKGIGDERRPVAKTSLQTLEGEAVPSEEVQIPEDTSGVEVDGTNLGRLLEQD